ncbi:hypothetical protein [Bacillus sp. SA1-12]|uniref:hypothetical protein n=1 Tax=Bacillus sp. SA1-12 TaxID=1455638 RepID=UPI0012E0A85B|nr:hypothetical protein [Bacillus sp. SA1-12]
MYSFIYNRYSLITEIADSLNRFLYEHPKTRDDLLKYLEISSVEFLPSSEGKFIKGKMKLEVNQIRVKEQIA